MRDEIVRKLNSTESRIYFDSEEVEYIVQDWVETHLRRKIHEIYLKDADLAYMIIRKTREVVYD